MPYLPYIKQIFFTTLGLLIFSSTQASSNTITIETEWLARHLSDPQVAVIDMSDSFQYQRFHIPGARHLPYEVINHTNRQRISYSVGPHTVAKIMAQLGITPKHTVVIYDDTGGLNAARLYWELQRLQHEKVALLDGGLVKWVREGRKISWTPPKLKSASYPVTDINDKILAERSDISKAKTLLDVRTTEEYQGHPRAPRSGHIPGALHFAWDDAVDFNTGFTMKPVDKVKSQLAQLGITDPNQEITLYCRSGHRAAHAFFTLKRLGWKNIRLYDGSMAEYEQDKSVALKKGKTP